MTTAKRTLELLPVSPARGSDAASGALIAGFVFAGGRVARTTRKQQESRIGHIWYKRRFAALFGDAGFQPAGAGMEVRLSPISRALLAIASAAVLAGCQRDACNNECTSGTVCDALTATCEASDGGTVCSTDSDCGAALPRCNAGGMCVECLGNSDCPAGVACDTNTDTCTAGCNGPQDCLSTPGKPQCNLGGVCVECTVDQDCADLNGKRRTCDPSADTCVLNPCMSDMDCDSDPSGNHACLSGACVQCATSTDCTTSGAPICDPTSNTCVNCVADTDCNQVGGQTCVMNLCQQTGCVSDSSCTGDKHCDSLTGACVQCLSTAQCDFGGECDGGACVQSPSCTADTQCLFGTLCNASSMSCVQCIVDTDCGTGQTCRSPGTCEAPDSCTVTANCGPGQVCTAGSCTMATCTTTSSFGTNTSVSSAATLPSPGSSTITSALCPNEPQYFVLSANSGDGVQATVQPATMGQAMTVQLYPGPGTGGGVAMGQTNRAGQVVATIDKVPAGVQAVLVVVGGEVDQSSSFTLTTLVNGTGLCAPSTNEPDSDQAHAIPVSAGTYTDTLCPEHQVWYAITAPINERPIATLTSSATAAEIALAIYTTVGSVEVLDSYSESNANGAASVTSVNTATSNGQTYWVSVVNSGEQSLAYSLTLQLIANAPPNDLCADASTMAPNSTVTGTTAGATNNELASCGGSGGDVFWNLQVTQPSAVTFNLAASGFDAVLSVEQGCGDVGERGCAGGTAMSQQLSFQALRAGNYLVRVAGSDSSNLGMYTLTNSVVPAQVPVNATCSAPIPLTFSGGTASVSGSVALSANSSANACGQPGGDAVYEFALSQPQKIDVALTGFPGGEVSIAPVGSCAAPLASECASASAAGDATLTVTAVPAGRYVLIIDGGNDVVGSFAVNVTLSGPIYAPLNNTCSSIEGTTMFDIPLGPSTIMGDTRAAMDTFTFGSTCSMGGGSAGDTVYHLGVTQPEEVSLQLTASTGFDATMELTGSPCGTGSEVDCSPGGDAHLREVLMPGDYYLWIGGYSAGTGTYTLATNVTVAPPVPPNQSCGTAQSVDLTTGSAMVTASTATASTQDSINPTNCLPEGGTTPSTLAGPNVVYAATIPAGKTLSAILNPANFDAALYVVSACPTTTCLAVADNHLVGGTDTVSVPNTSGAAQQVFVVVGSWYSGAWGDFSLALELN